MMIRAQQCKKFHIVVKYCLNCGSPLHLRNTRDIKRKKFCSHSCRAAYTHISFSDNKDALLELAFNYPPFWDLGNGITLRKECHQKRHPNINLFKNGEKYAVASSA